MVMYPLKFKKSSPYPTPCKVLFLTGLFFCLVSENPQLVMEKKNTTTNKSSKLQMTMNVIYRRYEVPIG